MRTFTVFDDPPRPASGSGDVLVKVGAGEVVLSWKDGNIIGVQPSADSDDGFKDDITDITMKTPLGIVTCIKCARDSVTGQMVCWDVPC